VGSLNSKAPCAGVAEHTSLGVTGNQQPVSLAVAMVVKPGRALLRTGRLDVKGDVGVDYVRGNLVDVMASNAHSNGKGAAVDLLRGVERDFVVNLGQRDARTDAVEVACGFEADEFG
jgi:hypothetical protein